MQCAYVYVALPCANGAGLAACGEPRINEGSEVFVSALGLAPQIEEFVEDVAGHLERSPYPIGAGVLLLHLDLADIVLLVGEHRVEKLRLLDREKQKR